VNNSYALLLPVLILVGHPAIAQNNRAIAQADVYDVLYDAYVQCDDNLDQSRSEFITEKLERGRGEEISIELIGKLLAHNVQLASNAIADKMKERERYVNETLASNKESSDQPVDSAEATKDRHRTIRQIDDFIRQKTFYVKVNECVIEVLSKTPQQKEAGSN